MEKERERGGGRQAGADERLAIPLRERGREGGWRRRGVVGEGGESRWRRSLGDL